MSAGPTRRLASLAIIGLSERSAMFFRTWLYRPLAEAHPTARFMGTSRVVNPRHEPGLIRIGAHTRIRGELFCFAHAGQIMIGDWCYIGEGSRIWSAKQVTIGNRVLISHGANIHDSIGHPRSPDSRHKHFKAILTGGHPQAVEFPAAAVCIDDDVWVGFGATIMRGVTLGRGAIVGAGSLVTQDVPPWTIAAGNPARPVGELPPDER